MFVLDLQIQRASWETLAMRASRCRIRYLIADGILLSNDKVHVGIKRLQQRHVSRAAFLFRSALPSCGELRTCSVATTSRVCTIAKWLFREDTKIVRRGLLMSAEL